VAATNRDIVEAIRQNQFREDLFHRLNVVQLCPTPLRERRSDVFSRAMNKNIARISPAALANLQAHNWPGNVRELRNVIERGVILEQTNEIRPCSLPEFQIEARLRKNDQGAPVATGQSIDEIVGSFEKELILNTLEQHRYNLTRTAEHLKISRHALRYRMQRLDIHAEGDSEEDIVKESTPC
jgi:transcriptional regulator with PAS, ATPase and Fis domain